MTTTDFLQGALSQERSLRAIDDHFATADLADPNLVEKLEEKLAAIPSAPGEDDPQGRSDFIEGENTYMKIEQLRKVTKQNLPVTLENLKKSKRVF